MGINWKVRINNLTWWGEVALAVIIPILSYYGLTGADMSSWGVVFDTLGKAVSNPYVLVITAMSLFNAIVDPTTKGVKDSDQAMTYDKPKAKGEE